MIQEEEAVVLTIGKKLHAKRELAFEGIDLEPFFFKARKGLF